MISGLFHVEQHRSGFTGEPPKYAKPPLKSDRSNHSRNQLIVLQFLALGKERKLMEVPNAFIGHIKQPTAAEASQTLGTTAALWDDLVGRMATSLGVTDQEWHST